MRKRDVPRICRVYSGRKLDRCIARVYSLRTASKRQRRVNMVKAGLGVVLVGGAAASAYYFYKKFKEENEA